MQRGAVVVAASEDDYGTSEGVLIVTAENL